MGEITIFNFQHEAEVRGEREYEMHITGSILMINGLLHFFSLKKRLLCIRRTNTRNQLVCPREKKAQKAGESARGHFLLRSTSSFSAAAARLFFLLSSSFGFFLRNS
jgi:hypothetical protein